MCKWCLGPKSLSVFRLLFSSDPILINCAEMILPLIQKQLGMFKCWILRRVMNSAVIFSLLSLLNEHITVYRNISTL